MEARFFFLHVEGSDEVIAQAAKTFASLVNGDAHDEPASRPPLPSLPSRPAAPALPAPRQRRRRKSAAATLPSPEPESPSPAKPAAQAKSGDDADAIRSRSNGVLLECEQRPGETFTINQAAKLAGVSRGSIDSKLSAQRKFSLHWTTQAGNGFRFRPVEK